MNRGSVAPRTSAYFFSTSGVSYAGSTEIDTNRTSGDVTAFDRATIFDVMIGHGPGQRVKMKSTTHVFPRRSSLETVWPSWLVSWNPGAGNRTGRPWARASV